MWNKVVLDNTIGAYIITAGLLLLLFMFKHILSKFLAGFIYKFVCIRWKTINREKFISLIIRPIKTFLVIFLGAFILNGLNYPNELDFVIRKNFTASLLFDKVIELLIITSFFWLVYRLVEFVSLILKERALNTPDSNDDQMVSFFRDLIKVVVVLAALIAIISVVFNKNVGSLLTGLSIVGAAIALAAKESLENLIASFIIFTDKPFMVGDSVKVNAINGTVEKIGLRSTRVRTLDKSLVTVPNKQMVDSVVDNISRLSQRRAVITLELSEKTSVAQVEKLITDIKQVVEADIEKIISRTVYLTNYSKNGATITLEFFTPVMPFSDFNILKEEIQIRIMKLVQENKLEFTSTTGTVNVFNEQAPPPKNDII